jgi:steroid delta-isomerase-like uncharacterized protein
MTFLERWFEEVWNKQREAAIDEMTIPEVTTHGLEHPDGTVVKGREGFKDFHKLFCSAFSDIHVKVEDTLTEGDKTMARCVVTGIHTGPGLGKPATGKPVQFTGMCIVRLENGKLAEAWNNFDMATMYRQLE